MTSEPLSQMVESITTRLAPRSEILEAYLFGSSARGRSGPLSDVDVAVYLGAMDPDDSSFGYASALAAELMAALPGTTVEIVVLNRASPLLYQRVLRDGIRLLTRDLPATTTREGTALSRYCDYVPQLAKIDAAQSARIERGRFGR